jgi:hypothetical protein
MGVATVFRNYGISIETKRPLPLTPSHQGRGKNYGNLL